MTLQSKIPSLSPPLTEPEPPLYHCTNTNFGAYLIVAKLLRFKEAALAANSEDVELRFYDPAGQGPSLLSRYNAGLGEAVAAKLLFEVRGYLLSEVKRVQTAAGVARGNH